MIIDLHRLSYEFQLCRLVVLFMIQLYTYRLIYHRIPYDIELFLFLL